LTYEHAFYNAACGDGHAMATADVPQVAQEETEGRLTVEIDGADQERAMRVDFRAR
jgi:hypothetical protein